MDPKNKNYKIKIQQLLSRGSAYCRFCHFLRNFENTDIIQSALELV